MNKKSDIDIENDIEKLVPTKSAYFIAYLVLFISSVSGGLIGYACAKIFVPNPSSLVEALFALISAGLICWSMSVVTSIGLKASVEFKSRKKLFPSSKRPSKILK